MTSDRDARRRHVTRPKPQITRTTPIDALPEFLSPEEFRTYLRIGRATTYDLISRGAIPFVRFGRLIRIPKSALLARR